MKKIIKYNIQILAVWFFYIALGYKGMLSEESIELLKTHYSATPREKRLIKRIEKINN
jgi:hypothetical protein